MIGSTRALEEEATRGPQSTHVGRGGKGSCRLDLVEDRSLLSEFGGEHRCATPTRVAVRGGG
jgi:hypothetical protein